MPNVNRDPLDGVRVCVFDAYGTLFDFAAAARSCRDVLGEATESLTAIWRDKQLQYTWLRAAQGRHADFWQARLRTKRSTPTTTGRLKTGKRRE